MNHPSLAATLRVAAVLICTVFSACKTTYKLPDDPLIAPEDQQELAYIPTYSKGVLADWPKGRELDRTDVSRVRLGEQVHAYHLGRLPSKDRREMHEAHTVYRVEQPPRWDTRLPATPMDSRGVVLGVVDPARQAIPDDTLIQQEREALSAKSALMRKSMAELDLLRAELLKKKAAFEKTEQDVTEIKAYLERTIAERNQMETSLKQATNRIDELEEAERLRIRSSSQGLLPKR